jgi:hypothetical protein
MLVIKRVERAKDPCSSLKSLTGAYAWRLLQRE